MTAARPEMKLESKSIVPLRGGTVLCREGRLWLSWPNSPDIVLSPGESRELPRKTLSIIQAVGGAATARLL